MALLLLLLAASLEVRAGRGRDHEDDDECPGMDWSDDAADGPGLLTPPHNRIYYAGGVTDAQVSLSWDVNKCGKDYDVVRRYLAFTINEGAPIVSDVIYEKDQEVKQATITVPSSTAQIDWLVYRECWDPPKNTWIGGLLGILLKRDFDSSHPLRNLDDVPYSGSGNVPPPGDSRKGWDVDRFYVKDKNPSRSGYDCYRSFKVCARPETPGQQSPADAFLLRSLPITFTWKDVSPADPDCLPRTGVAFRYIFRVYAQGSNTPLFEASVPLGSSSYTWSNNALSSGNYQWSVVATRAVSDSSLALPSSMPTVTTTEFKRGFRYCTPDLAPSKPALVSPAASQLIQQAPPAGTTSLAVTLSWSLDTFGWTCLDASRSFELQFSPSQAFPGTSTTTIQLSATTTSRADNFATGTWYWRVRANNGVLSTLSDVGSFTVCALFPPAAFQPLEPPNNVQGIMFSSIHFAWQESSSTSACAPSPITYRLYSAISPSQQYTLNYTGSELQFNTSIDKGSWTWYVTATDAHGLMRKSPTFSFVTLASECTIIPPSTPELYQPTFGWDTGASALRASFSWGPIDLGVTCQGSTVKRADPASVTLIVLSSPGGVQVLNQNLGTDITSFSATFGAGDYTWSLVVDNGVNVTESAAESFSVCDFGPLLQPFAANFAPENDKVFLDASAPALLTWEYTYPQFSCMGGSVVYRLSISETSTEADLVSETFHNQSTLSYSLASMQQVTGSWEWTLTQDASGVPFPDLPSQSFSGTFHTCTPAFPAAPSLTGPVRFTTLVGGSANLSWADPHNLTDSCTPLIGLGLLTEQYRYSIVRTRKPDFSGLPSQEVALADRAGPTSFSTLLSDLEAGLVYWRVFVTKQVLIGSQVAFSRVKESPISLFYVCLKAPPRAPQLQGPPDGVVFERCNITTTLAWRGMYFEDFGTDCTQSPDYGLRVHIGLDPENPSNKTVAALSTDDSLTISTVDGLLPSTTYYWRVEAFNANMSTFSNISTFVTPDTSIPACSGHGICLVSGLCECRPAYMGPDCSEERPTEPPPATTGGSQKDFPVATVAGSVAGVLFALLLLAIVGFVFLKRRADRALLMPERPPPDFPPLVFTMPQGYPPLSQDKIVPWISFEQLFFANNFALSFALLDSTQATEIDDIVKSLVFIIESHKKGGAFVKALISKDLREKEAAHTLTSATLFRDNSHASKAFKNYGKIVGLPYIFYIFADPMYDICSTPFSETGQPEVGADAKADAKAAKRKSGAAIELKEVVVRRFSSRPTKSPLFDVGSFEVDPNKMGQEDDIISNAIFLQLKCQKLLVQIFRSSHILPPSLLEIFSHLMEEVQKYLTRQDGFNSVAAFLFLRLINPAILFPYQHGLLEAPPNNDALTRQLILITKVMQNLANNVHFGGKEQHMVPMNDFIDSNSDSLRNFIDSIINRQPPPTDASDAAAAHSASSHNLLPLAYLRKDSKKQEERKEDDFFKPLEVPRPTVEVALTLVYNQLHRQKARVFEALEKYCSEEEVRLFSNKYTAIVKELGEPIPRNATLKKGDE